MIRRRKRDTKKSFRGGFSIAELSLYFILALVAITGVISGYNKLSVSQEANANFQTVTSVIDGIERVKLLNGNVYPVATSQEISTMTDLANELGGVENMKDVSSWTYNCSSGANQAVTLTTDNFDNANVANLVATKITKVKQPWTASVSGLTVTATLNNVTCR